MQTGHTTIINMFVSVMNNAKFLPLKVGIILGLPSVDYVLGKCLFKIHNFI